MTLVDATWKGEIGNSDWQERVIAKTDAAVVWTKGYIKKTNANKYVKYLKYVLKHKWYVFVECCNRGLIWQGIIHDWSKFMPCEFIPYANNFFGTDEDKVNYKKRMKVAWLHHQNCNPHHWQYWIQYKKGGSMAFPMPPKYAKEMLADWAGAGKTQGNTHPDEVREWYLNNKDDMLLYSGTRAWIESELNVNN